jgi:ATP-dependent protease ClpP protease subunit
MKRIAIEGIVGWDLMAADVREQLDQANGEEIDLIVNSPGGSVFEGFAIFNALRDYSRAGGKIHARVVGFAASMSSYIPMAASDVVIEDNAVWMIHNPWSLAVGDQNDLRAEAEVLEGLSGLMATAYERKTGKDRADVRAMMDAETWLFGQEIADAGFADSVVPAGDGPEDKADAVAQAKAAVRAMAARMRAEPEKHALREVAAQLGIKQALAPAHSDREEHQAHSDLETSGKEGQVNTLTAVMAALVALSAEELQKVTAENKSEIAKRFGFDPDAQGALAVANEKARLLADERDAIAKKLAVLEAEKNAAAKKGVIEGALTAGRIAPKNRAAWEALYDKQPEETTKLLAEAAPVVPLGSFGSPGGGGEGAAITAEDQAALARFAASHPELTAEQAREQYLKYSK